MVLSHHAKFQLTTTTGSRFFRTVFVEILRPPLMALVPEAGLRISGSDIRGSPQTLMPSRGNLSVLEERFLANCLLHDFEIFLAAAVVMTGSTCVVQCYNNESNHRAGISLHQSPASGPAMEKWTMFLLTYNANFNPRSIFVVVCFDHFTDEFFPGGCLCHKIPEVDHSICPFQLHGKKPGKIKNII